MNMIAGIARLLNDRIDWLLKSTKVPFEIIINRLL